MQEKIETINTINLQISRAKSFLQALKEGTKGKEKNEHYVYSFSEMSVKVLCLGQHNENLGEYGSHIMDNVLSQKCAVVIIPIVEAEIEYLQDKLTTLVK